MQSGSFSGPGISPVSNVFSIRSSSSQNAGSSSLRAASSLMFSHGAAVLEAPAPSPPISVPVSAVPSVSFALCYPCAPQDPLRAGVGSSDEADDPFRFFSGDPLAADDPFDQVSGDPFAADDPLYTVDGDPIAFDDPTVLLLFPNGISSVSTVEAFPLDRFAAQSRMSPEYLLSPFSGVIVPSPPSSSRNPHRLGREKDMKFPGCSGISSGKFSKSSL